MPNALGYFQVCSTYCCTEPGWPPCECAANPPAYWTVDVANLGSWSPYFTCPNGDLQLTCSNLNGTWVLQQVEPAPDWVYDLDESMRACIWWCAVPDPACGYTWAFLRYGSAADVEFGFVNDDMSLYMSWTQMSTTLDDCCDTTAFNLGWNPYNSGTYCGQQVPQENQYVTVASGGCS